MIAKMIPPVWSWMAWWWVISPLVVDMSTCPVMVGRILLLFRKSTIFIFFYRRWLHHHYFLYFTIYYYFTVGSVFLLVFPLLNNFLVGCCPTVLVSLILALIEVSVNRLLDCFSSFSARTFYNTFHWTFCIFRFRCLGWLLTERLVVFNFCTTVRLTSSSFHNRS